jgi:hypothetical protein
VRLMLAALRTELFHFKTLGRRLFVFRVAIVPIFALSALERDDFTRHGLLLTF